MTSSVDLPEAVRQLQLRRAFKGHSPGIEKCMGITSEAKFAIADDDVLKHSVIVPSRQKTSVATYTIQKRRRWCCCK